MFLLYRISQAFSIGNCAAVRRKAGENGLFPEKAKKAEHNFDEMNYHKFGLVGACRGDAEKDSNPVFNINVY